MWGVRALELATVGRAQLQLVCVDISFGLCSNTSLWSCMSDQLEHAVCTDAQSLYVMSFWGGGVGKHGIQQHMCTVPADSLTSYPLTLQSWPDLGLVHNQVHGSHICVLQSVGVTRGLRLQYDGRLQCTCMQ
jgi:hypothetical protein